VVDLSAVFAIGIVGGLSMGLMLAWIPRAAEAMKRGVEGYYG